MGSLEISAATSFVLLETRNSSQPFGPESLFHPIVSWPPHGDAHQAVPDTHPAFGRLEWLGLNRNRLFLSPMPNSECGSVAFRVEEQGVENGVDLGKLQSHHVEVFRPD